MKEFLTTKSGRISLARDEYRSHSVHLIQPDNPFMQYAELVLNGKIIRYKTNEEVLTDSKELISQLS